MAPDTPLLLDLDGTLFDTIQDIAASLNHVRERFALPSVSTATARTLIGQGADYLLRHGLKDAAEPPTDLNTAMRWYVAHHETQCTGFARPFPGVLETLARWHAAGRPLAVVTNKPEALAHKLLEHFDTLRFVGAVVGGDTTAERKPSPLPLHEALRRLGCDPTASHIMVGDGLPDVRSGKASGARTIAVTYGYVTPERLAEEHPDGFWTQFGGPTLDSWPPGEDVVAL